MTNDPQDHVPQKAADTGKSVHLSASAGSGKTRALKDRYLALLEALDHRGLNIDQAVAITFTDKAAAEIKERVLRDLPETMLKNIIRGKQDLRISTIHSFCMNLLKRYPLEAGLPPDFGVLDTRDQAYKVEQAIESALEEFCGDGLIMAPLNAFTTDEIIASLEFLLSIRSKLKRLEIDANGPDGFLRAVKAGMEVEKNGAELTELIARAESRTCLRTMESLLCPQGDYYDLCRGDDHLQLAKLMEDGSNVRLTEAVVRLYFTKENTPRKNASIAKKNYSGENRVDYEKTFFLVQDLLGQVKRLQARVNAGQEAISLLQLFQRAEKNYQESKLREGLLDFDDLEIYAYRLLQGQESPDILYWLDRKILHFLVDEFQDTSDIQWAILNKLTEEIFAGQGASKPMQPTLFVVGDEKQSIYRFREANYRLFENVQHKMEGNIPVGSREVLTLDKNFRSTPEIIEMVNSVFSALWQGSYQPSAVERKDHNGSVRLIELLQETEATEADILAQEIQSLVKQGTIVYEKAQTPPVNAIGDQEWIARPAGYKDCAILIQSRTRLKQYEAALQSIGVPFRVVGGIGFYEEDEIQALLNVLFFLWNHDDRLNLVAALKSPLFGLTDNDLFDLMQEGRLLVDALKVRKPGIRDVLHTWMNLAGLVPLSGLIHRIVEDTGAYVRFGRRNPQAIFNIDKLLDTAREFDRRGYTTLQDFVERVRTIREAEQREATADMNLPGFQGAVSILTVHKAKGLEYPVIFLPGMNQAQRSVTQGPQVIVGETSGAVRMAIKDAANPLYQELWEEEKEELQREHQRLLYVAMTRARDHLVMIGTHRDDKTPIKQNTWLGYVHQAAPRVLLEAPLESSSGIRRYACPAPSDKIELTPHASFPLPAEEPYTMPPLNIQQLIENLSPLPHSLSWEWKRATDFIDQDKEASREPASLPSTTRTISPLTRGIVFHRCLEEFTTKGSCDFQSIITDHFEILTSPDVVQQEFMREARNVVNAVLDNKELAWIFERTPGSYSELPFLLKKDNSLVSGIIDRVVIKEGKGFVIDYKSISVGNEEALTSGNNHYRPQIAIYCEAVKEIFRLEHVEGYLLFLDSNRLELVVSN